MLSLDDMEKKFYQEQYAPGFSTGAIVARRNLVKNPKAAVDTSFVGQYSANVVVITRVTGLTSPIPVTTGIQFVIAPATGGTAGVIFSSSLGTAPSTKSYTGSFWIRRDSGTDDVKIAFSGVIAGSVIPFSGTNWIRVFFTASIATGLPINLGVRTDAIATGSTYTITGVKVEEGTSTGDFYFDGDTADYTNGNYQWVGTANASESTLTIPEPVISENLAFNPYLLDATSIATMGTWFPTYSKDTTVFNSKTFCSKYSWGPGSTNSAGVKALVSKLIANTTYYVEVVFRLNRANTGRIYAEYGLMAGDAYQSRGGTVTSFAANTWITHRDSVTIGPDSSEAGGKGIGLLLTNVQDTDVIWIDSIFISTVPSGYFDGNSPNAFWSGTPNNSTSFLKDVNARDLPYIEKNYWEKTSGLTPAAQYSFNDHMRASLVVSESPNTGTIGDLLMARAVRLDPGSNKSFADRMFNYYKTQLGL